MDQNVAIVVWVVFPALALVWAQVSLWHRRRVLRQARPPGSLPVARLASSADPVKPHSAIAS